MLGFKFFHMRKDAYRLNALTKDRLVSLADQIVPKVLNNHVAFPRVHWLFVNADQECTRCLLDCAAPGTLYSRIESVNIILFELNQVALLGPRSPPKFQNIHQCNRIFRLPWT